MGIVSVIPSLTVIEAVLRHLAETWRSLLLVMPLLSDLAISLSTLGRHDDALLEARRAVELQPDIAMGHHALGVALGSAGRIADAAFEFRRAIELDPTGAASRANLERAEGSPSSRRDAQRNGRRQR